MRPFLPLLLSPCLLLAPAMAQRPSSWAALSVPGGVQTSGLIQQGKFLAYQEPSLLHVFDAATRRWSAFGLAPTTTVRITNDWVLLFDSGSATAIGAYRGRAATVALGPGAAVLNPIGQINDTVLAVRDASSLHVFSAFTGRWVSRPISGTPGVFLHRNVAVYVEGGSAYAFSGFQGSWIPHPVSGQVSSIFAQGNVAGFADAAGLHCFSAWSDRWSSTGVPAGNPGLLLGNDLALWWGSQGLLAYSSLLGTFTGSIVPAPAAATVDERVAAVSGPAGHALYSAVTGTWTILPQPSAQVVRARSDLILLHEPSALHAFGSLSGQIATLAQPVASDASTETVAAALLANGDPMLYSIFANRWVGVPADVQRSRIPDVASNGAVLTAGNAQYAFSARSARFVRRSATGTAQVHVDQASSILAVSDASGLAVFEPHREVWLEHARSSAQPIGVSIWRTTLVALDGNVAIGFGSQHGTLETVSLPGAVVETKTNSECGRVVLANDVYGYSATGDLTTYAQFPEFRRMQPIGSLLHIQASPGTFALVAGCASAGFASAPLQLPFGELLLDLQSLQVFPMPATDADGRTELVLAIPPDPVLRGFELGLQAAVLPSGGQAYLSRLASVRVQ
jgi:hypothetical protein